MPTKCGVPIWKKTLNRLKMYNDERLDWFLDWKTRLATETFETADYQLPTTAGRLNRNIQNFHWQKTKDFTEHQLPDLTATRGHDFKLKKERPRWDMLKFSFFHRIVDHWNNLPSSIVTSPNLNCFENRLDKYFKNHPILYNPYASRSYRIRAEEQAPEANPTA